MEEPGDFLEDFYIDGLSSGPGSFSLLVYDDATDQVTNASGSDATVEVHVKGLDTHCTDYGIEAELIAP